MTLASLRKTVGHYKNVVSSIESVDSQQLEQLKGLPFYDWVTSSENRANPEQTDFNHAIGLPEKNAEKNGVAFPLFDYEQMLLTRDQGVIPQEGVLEQEPTDEVAEKKVCEYGTSPSGACYPPPKCPAGTVLAPGTGGDCRPPPVPPAAREVAPEVPPEVIEQAPEETPAEEQPSEDSNSEDNGNN